MEFVFLNAAGQTLFVRGDMETGHWSQEQKNVTVTFPYDKNKVIQTGQRIAFRDPVTDNIEVFEIINVQNHEPDHYQQLTAEQICVAELSDEHINASEITNKTAAQALTTVLTGTLWSVGNNTASGTQSADISRGSVWDAINVIQQNWNVYITQRVVISSAGAIIGRYLDISPATGTWRGIRLSIRKNFMDPSVTYDDAEVYTALYGYGGNVNVPHTGSDDTQEELTFKDVVWTATSSHPAKPANQTYLEWPEKTAIYGRNGRPRYGYYQNANIQDANVLLEKTWESLQLSCNPKISISGSCVDLYRLGYNDQPIRLHDIAIVEIEETGEVFQKQIICCDIDLADPSSTTVEIGDYIENIVYIARDTNKKASGGGGGGLSKKSKTELENDEIKTFTEFTKNDEYIGMIIGTRQGDAYIKVGEITLAINNSGESGSYETTAYINANHVNISATNTAHLLSGSITYDANGNLVLHESSGGGVIVEHNNSGTLAQFGVWDRGNLTGGIMVDQINGQTGTVVKILASRLDITGDTIANWIQATDISVADFECQTFYASMDATFDGDISAGDVSCDGVYADTLSAGDSLSVNGDEAEWQSQQVVTSVSQTRTTSRTWLCSDGDYTGQLVRYITPTTETINYLGAANTQPS